MRIAVREIVAALDRVVDPCSNALGVPLGLAAMGLVTNVAVDRAAGRIDVRLRVTSPCCSYGPTMAAAAATELSKVAGIVDARVTIDHSATWTPADMRPRAAAALDERRRRTIEMTAVRPYEWHRWKELP